MGKAALDAQLGPRRFAMNFVVTPLVEFPILVEGYVQDVRLLWAHRLNEVVV